MTIWIKPPAASCPGAPQKRAMYRANRLRRSVSHATLLAGLSMLEFGGMSGEAFAACTGTAPNYVCSGAETSPQMVYESGPVSVTTAPGFSVNAVSGSALNVFGADSVSYIDANASTLNSTDGMGLYANASSTGTAPGSLTIQTNGDISGIGGGIQAQNYGSGFGGSLDIKVGNVSSSNGNGLYAMSDGSSKIEAKNISAGQMGIYAMNYPSGGASPAGAMSIRADSITAGQMGVYAMGFGPMSVDVGAITVTDAGSYGIYAMGYYSSASPAGAMSIKVDSIIGVLYGIQAMGYGPMSVEVGSVTATSTSGNGIDIRGLMAASISVKATDVRAS
jgi:hypothetical protein